MVGSATSNPHLNDIETVESLNTTDVACFEVQPQMRVLKSWNTPSNLRGFRDFLVLFFMPFAYGLITRLPFIYFVVIMRETYEISWNMCGIYIGLYQACRAVINAYAMLHPNIAHVLGKVIGLTGYVLLLISSYESSKVLFLVGTIIGGFSETFVCNQIYVKEYCKDVHKVNRLLNLQYFAVMVAVTLSFAIGGFSVQHFGIRGPAVIGITWSLLELVAISLYYLLKNQWMGVEETPPSETDSENDSSQRNKKDSGSDKSFLSSFQASNISPNYINLLICLCFGFESVTIGYNLSITPLYTHEKFGKELQDIGFLLASGAACGTFLAVLVTFFKPLKRFWYDRVQFPYILYISLIGIGVGVLVAAIPFFAVHVTGVLVLMAFNDVALLTLNPILGTISSNAAFKLVGPLGQFFRRVVNVVAATSAPIFFSWFEQLPYIVSGVVTLLSTVAVCIIFEHRRRVNHSQLDEKWLSGIDVVTFVEREILSRMISEKHFDPIDESEQPNTQLQRHEYRLDCNN